MWTYRVTFLDSNVIRKLGDYFHNNRMKTSEEIEMILSRDKSLTLDVRWKPMNKVSEYKTLKVIPSDKIDKKSVARFFNRTLAVSSWPSKLLIKGVDFKCIKEEFEKFGIEVHICFFSTQVHGWVHCNEFMVDQIVTWTLKYHKDTGEIVFRPYIAKDIRLFLLNKGSVTLADIVRPLINLMMKVAG